MTDPERTLEAVIFDVDGTLVDSERDGHRVAFNTAFEEFGLADRWDVETYGELLTITGGARRLTHWFSSHGMPADDARELAIPIHRRKTELMTELVRSGTVVPRPGVTDLIDGLRDRGMHMHVATTGSRAWVEPLLATTFGDRFEIVVTGTEVPQLKPEPAAYREVLRRCGTRPDQAIAIEDSTNGLRAAIAARLDCVVTYNHYTSADDFTGAALVVDDARDPAVERWLDRRITR